MTNKLKMFLDSYIKSDTRYDKINVFPLMCGTGKSTYLRYLISDAVREGLWIIIITDRIDNLGNLITSAEDQEFNDFIQANQDKIALLTSKNAGEVYPDLHRMQVVLMATQRYFNLSVTDIRALTKRRKKIIFDEKPFILECRKIGVKALNDVDTALREDINDTTNQETKQSMIAFWSKINTELQTLMQQNEHDNDSFRSEKIVPPQQFVIDSAELKDFYEITLSYRKLFRFPDVLKTIEAVNQLITCGGLITSTKKGTKKSETEYDNFYSVIVNNVAKLTDIDANVFVLDGTADVSPEYYLQCFNIVDCSRFSRRLDKLTLNLINLNTSKSKLTASGKQTEDYINEISNYIKSAPVRYNVLFTYARIEQFFSTLFQTEHFGNIKGTNKYRDEKNIAQVGLHAFPISVYMLFAGEIERYNHYSNFTNIVCDIDTIDKIMCGFIFADLEQNLFRGCIRSESSNQEMNYMVFFNSADKSMLLNMIKRRYARLGATINCIQTPRAFVNLKADSRKTKNPTVKQKFHKFIDGLQSGTTFTKSDIMVACAITSSQYKDLTKAKELQNYKTDKQGIFKK